MLQKGIDVYHVNIDSVMSKEPKWIFDYEMAVNALQKMSDLTITGMPVVDATEHVVGSILMQDIFKAGIVR